MEPCPLEELWKRARGCQASRSQRTSTPGERLKDQEYNSKGEYGGDGIDPEALRELQGIPSRLGAHDFEILEVPDGRSL